jgi:hypothetical protein
MSDLFLCDILNNNVVSGVCEKYVLNKSKEKLFLKKPCLSGNSNSRKSKSSVCIRTIKSLDSGYFPVYHSCFATRGIRLPKPNDFDETRKIGGN